MAELLTHAGKISHEMAMKKSEEKLVKYRSTQKDLGREQSIKEIEEDIQCLKQSRK